MRTFRVSVTVGGIGTFTARVNANTASVDCGDVTLGTGQIDGEGAFVSWEAEDGSEWMDAPEVAAAVETAIMETISACGRMFRLQGVNGEEIVTWEEFCEANESDEYACADVRALDIGESASGGGGAAAEWIIIRIA